MERVLVLSGRDDDILRSRWFVRTDRWLARFLVHPQDAFVVRHLAGLMLVCGFAAYANFFFSWWYVPLDYAAIVLNGEAIGRFFHVLSHRPIFRKPFAWLNSAPIWLASPWIGEPPYLFAVEHVANHHAQDNGPGDIGSTLGYQRDSWGQLGRYVLDFFVGGSGPIGLAAMFRRGKGGRVWRRRFYVGQMLFWGLVLVRLWFDWVAALTLLIVPYLFVQGVNRANNWTEHAFVNPACPTHPLGNAYTIVNSRFNTGIGYNEGYHTAHHQRPGLPNHLWPRHFREHLAAYCAADHLVFQGVSTNDIFFMLMAKDFTALARHVVTLPGRPRSEAEIVAMLRARVRPIAYGSADHSSLGGQP